MWCSLRSAPPSRTICAHPTENVGRDARKPRLLRLDSRLVCQNVNMPVSESKAAVDRFSGPDGIKGERSIGSGFEARNAALHVSDRALERIRVPDRCAMRPSRFENRVPHTMQTVVSPMYCKITLTILCLMRACWAKALLDWNDAPHTHYTRERQLCKQDCPSLWPSQCLWGHCKHHHDM